VGASLLLVAVSLTWCSAARCGHHPAQKAILATPDLPEPLPSFDFTFFDFTVPPPAEPRPTTASAAGRVVTRAFPRRSRVLAGHKPFSGSRVPIICGSRAWSKWKPGPYCHYTSCRCERGVPASHVDACADQPCP
jgi:hypothetical protein